jgi:hypothetical protein
MSVRVAALTAAVFASLGTTVAIASAPPASACPSGYYKAASGNCVHRPICHVPTQPPGATIQCPDGCWSFSEHPDDDYTCHGHNTPA